MNNKWTFWRRGLSLALVIPFNLLSVYALACPIVCSPRNCSDAAKASAIAGMGGCHKKCCPAHHPRSHEKQSVPCGTPAKGCISHTQQPAFLILGAPVAVQRQSVLTITPGLRIFSPASAISFFIHISLPPPGSLSGRAICQKESFLRI